MSEDLGGWLPIEQYDAMKKKPENAAFLFAPTLGRRGDIELGATVEMKRNYGRRQCVGWAPLPDTPANIAAVPLR